MRSRPVSAAVLVVTGVLLLLAPQVLPSYYLSVATRIALIGTFAVAFNIVFGMGGMPSLGHAAFFGTGAYIVGLGGTRWDWSFATTMLVALVAGVLLSLVFGLLSQRVEGIYLLLMTLALAQAVWGLAFQFVGLTRGDMGITGVSRDTIPLPVSSATSFHYFSLVCCALLVAALAWFLRTPVGRAIVGVRESPTRMASLGYRVATYKVVAFVVSGTVSAVVGALYGYQQGFVGVETLDWTLSATVLLAAILGGTTTLLGPALGVAVLLTLETALGLYTARWTAVLGIIYMVTILVMPQGLLGTRPRPAAEQAAEDESPSVQVASRPRGERTPT